MTESLPITLCFQIPLTKAKLLSFKISTEMSSVQQLDQVNYQRNLFNGSSIDYYFLCAVQFKVDDTDKALCFSALLKSFFFIENSRRFLQKIERNVQNGKKITLNLQNGTTMTLVSVEDDYIGILCTDYLKNNRYLGKKGSTGSNRIVQKEKKNVVLGTVNYGHRGPLNLNNISKCFNKLILKKKKGKAALTKVNIDMDKQLLIEEITKKKEIYKNKFKIAKMTSKNILDYYKENNTEPFDNELSDTLIRQSLLEVDPELQAAVISKFFEDLNWRFTPLKNVTDATVGNFHVDVDAAVLELVIHPSDGVYNFVDLSEYEDEVLSMLYQYLTEKVFHAAFGSDYSFEISKDELRTTDPISGHAYKFPKSNYSYIKVPTGKAMVLNILIRFLSDGGQFSSSVNIDIVWHALCCSYLFLAKNTAFSGKAAAFEISTKPKCFRCFQGPKVIILAVLLLATRYSIEVIFETYNSKMFFELNVNGHQNICEKYEEKRFY